MLYVSNLGALVSDDQILEQVFPAARVKPTAGFNAAARAGVAQAIRMRRIPFDVSSCRGVRPIKATITRTSGGAALKFGGTTGPAAPFVIAAGALLTLFGAIFAHHARAVAKEQSISCAAVPAANDAIDAIDEAVRARAATPQQGIQALDQLAADFARSIQAILKMNPSQCNAACQYTLGLAGAIARLKADYQEMAIPVRTGTAVPAFIAAAGKNPWPWIIGAGAAAYALL